MPWRTGVGGSYSPSPGPACWGRSTDSSRGRGLSASWRGFGRWWQCGGGGRPILDEVVAQTYPVRAFVPWRSTAHGPCATSRMLPAWAPQLPVSPSPAISLASRNSASPSIAVSPRPRPTHPGHPHRAPINTSVRGPFRCPRGLSVSACGASAPLAGLRPAPAASQPDATNPAVPTRRRECQTASYSVWHCCLGTPRSRTNTSVLGIGVAP